MSSHWHDRDPAKIEIDHWFNFSCFLSRLHTHDVWCSWVDGYPSSGPAAAGRGCGERGVDGIYLHRVFLERSNDWCQALITFLMRTRKD